MMKKKIQSIFKLEMEEEVRSIEEINGLGSVNRIFEVVGENVAYIIRLNEGLHKNIEYKKEIWCLGKVAKLGIPSPEVIKAGIYENAVFMIQNKISGINGIQCSKVEKRAIWEDLGKYAKWFHQVSEIEVAEVIEDEFHENWKARLRYNIEQLHENDRLLESKVVTPKEQVKMNRVLESLGEKDFKVGLIHGDLCPRNVIRPNGKTFLLDWGTAEINVVPHSEIGLVKMSKEADENEFGLFLQGLEISEEAFIELEGDIRKLNLLHRLDKYRWAESYDIQNIRKYGKSIREAFEVLKL